MLRRAKPTADATATDDAKCAMGRSTAAEHLTRAHAALGVAAEAASARGLGREWERLFGVDEKLSSEGFVEACRSLIELSTEGADVSVLGDC